MVTRLAQITEKSSEVIGSVTMHNNLYQAAQRCGWQCLLVIPRLWLFDTTGHTEREVMKLSTLTRISSRLSLFKFI